MLSMAQYAMNRPTRYVEVTSETWDKYKKATGLRKLDMHRAIFYSTYKIDLVGMNLRRMEHPILEGRIPSGYAFGEKKHNKTVIGEIEREIAGSKS